MNRLRLNKEFGVEFTLKEVLRKGPVVGRLICPNPKVLYKQIVNRKEEVS